MYVSRKGLCLNEFRSIRDLKLKVSRGPHETESKVWRAALKNEDFFELISNVFEIGPIFLLKFPFFPDVRWPHWTLLQAACLRPLV